jgi:hypothetical protein
MMGMYPDLYAIDTAILTEIGEDPDDKATRDTWAALLLLEHNNTLRDICARFLHPTVSELIKLDANRKFLAYDVLKHECANVLGVTNAEDYSKDAGGSLGTQYAFYDTAPGEYIVPGAAASGSVWVKYKYIPDAMTDNTTKEGSSVPEEVPDAYRKAFVYNGIAAIRRSRGMFQSMATYQTLAEDVLSGLIKKSQPKHVENRLFRSKSTIRNQYNLPI